MILPQHVSTSAGGTDCQSRLNYSQRAPRRRTCRGALLCAARMSGYEGARGRPAPLLQVPALQQAYCMNIPSEWDDDELCLSFKNVVRGVVSARVRCGVCRLCNAIPNPPPPAILSALTLAPGGL